MTGQEKGRIVNGLISTRKLKGDPRTYHDVQLFDGRLECLGQGSVIKYLNTQGVNRNIVLHAYLIHSNISDGVGFTPRICQEQEITSIEGWLHRSTVGYEDTHDAAKSALYTLHPHNRCHEARHDQPEDDNNGTFGIANEPKTFPHHKT